MRHGILFLGLAVPVVESEWCCPSWRKSVSLLFAPLGVNHGECNFCRVSRSKNGINSHGNSAFRHRVLGYRVSTANTQLSHLQSFPVLHIWGGGCFCSGFFFISSSFFFEGVGGLPNFLYIVKLTHALIKTNKPEYKEKKLYNSTFIYQ